MSKEAPQGNAREPIRIAAMKFVTPQSGPHDVLSGVPDALRSREVDPLRIYALEYHPWVRRFKITNLKTGVSFGVHEHRVDWSQTLAEWQEAQEFAAAKKAKAG